MPERLSEITEDIRTRMDALHKAREHALAEGRKIIQVSSRAIKHLHRRQQEQADELIAEVRERVRAVVLRMEPFPSLKHAPYLQDSIKEYVEAVTFRALLRAEPLPAPGELGVEPQAYLNGVCEAASECRRYALDELRHGRDEEAQRLVNEMEDVYDELLTFDFPDALTSHLRRNLDSLRGVLERTHSDVALAAMQIKLVEELKRAGKER
ncbi:MAG: haloacid dehalogenase [Armatimonadetes bacterium]|nr:haloacid dehalogenase [Armatimonadota bacterium]